MSVIDFARTRSVLGLLGTHVHQFLGGFKRKTIKPFILLIFFITITKHSIFCRSNDLKGQGHAM